MSTAARPVPLPPPLRADAVFRWALRALGLVAPALAVALGIQLYHDAALARHAFGWGFLTGSRWDAVFNHFGAWPFIFGTLVTTAVALILAAPLGVGTAVFLAEMAPACLSWCPGSKPTPSRG
jgi:phosphate transport system permease protein